MHASPHFRYREFDCHNGVPVPQHAYDDVRALCTDFLEPLRSLYGPVRVVSGYRTARYNAVVGGAPASMHVYKAHRRGAAADVACARGRPADWYETLDAMGAPGLGAYDDHVHVDNRAQHARW